VARVNDDRRLPWYVIAAPFVLFGFMLLYALTGPWT
jgi:hypothetical protein